MSQDILKEVEDEGGKSEDLAAQVSEAATEAVEVKETEFKKAIKEITAKGYEEMSKHDTGAEKLDYHTSEHPKRVEAATRELGKILNLSERQIDILGAVAAWHDTKIESNKPPKNGKEPDPNNLKGMIARHRGAKDGDNNDGDPNKPGLTKAAREGGGVGKKGSEGNEALSARALEAEMKNAKDASGKDVFTSDEIKFAAWAIEATYPDTDLKPSNGFKGDTFKEYPDFDVMVEQNGAAGGDLAKVLEDLKADGVERGPLFYQPHLEGPLEDNVKIQEIDGNPTLSDEQKKQKKIELKIGEFKKVPREVLIMGLADLGGVGLVDEETFRQDGNAEMREVYHNLRNPEVMGRLLKGETEQDVKDRALVAKEVFIGWAESQAGFAVKQALRFEKIIHLLKKQDGLSQQEEDGLRQEFSHFTKNIVAANARAKWLKLAYEVNKAEPSKDLYAEEESRGVGERQAFQILAGEMGYDLNQES